ncbi:hypothetical protein [Salicibibacter kimchii]|uniref:Uncharacterized protein n=1 Tax=Salicibibacter kimchii TaxID=2099786 RepID=A0A345BUJ7_9BACI|nr:hypothetical protein [Salicibibacter kimchii]AXF54628.1 hypothetical protein DT065_00435 [Salicibibacter kimchii]
MSQRGNTPGRMNREPNAPGDEIPAFTPQYWESDGHARDVSEDYPYPVKDSSVEDRLNNLLDKQSEIIEKQSEILERLNEPIDTQVTGSNVEEMETLVNAETVDPGDFAQTGYANADARLSYFAIETTASEWRLEGRRTPWSNSIGREGVYFYPTGDVQGSYSSRNPFVCFQMISHGNNINETIESIAEAEKFRLFTDGGYIRVRNRSEEAATVTIRLYKIGVEQ